MAELKDTTVNGILNATEQVQDNGQRAYSPLNEPPCEDIVTQINSTVSSIKTTVEDIKSILDGTWSKSLQDSTWGEINAISRAGMAAKAFNIGDTKTFTINGTSYTVRIVGFNHDQLSDGSYAGITFEMTSLFSSYHKMNSSDTNVGGWKDSELREYLKSDLYNLINSDLRAVIKSVQKRTTSGSQSTEIQITYDRIWLFSYTELNPKAIFLEAGYEDEGTTYEYYIEHPSNSDRVKQRSGSSDYWWLRSPYIDDSNCFRSVIHNGYIGYVQASYSIGGVSFGFCV